MGVRCPYICSHIRFFSLKNTTLWKEAWAGGVPDAGTVLFVEQDASHMGVFNCENSSIYTLGKCTFLCGQLHFKKVNKCLDKNG